MNTHETIFELRAFLEQLRALQGRARHIDDPDVRARVQALLDTSKLIVATNALSTELDCDLTFAEIDDSYERKAA